MMRHLQRLLGGMMWACLISCSGSPSPYSTPLSSASPAAATAALPSVNRASAPADIRYTEVLPLFNQRVKAASVAPADRRLINPETMALPGTAVLDGSGDQLRVESLSNDAVFKDVMIESPVDLGQVTISVADIDGITITPRLVTSWFQAGITTKKRSDAGALTYELLLSNDLETPAAGIWRKSSRGGWIYHPPDVVLGDVLTTRLAANTARRLLLRFEVSDQVAKGVYRTQIEIRRSQPDGSLLSILPVDISVQPVALTRSLDRRYHLTLYTALKIDPAQERPGAYVNALRVPGDQAQRRTVLRHYLEDIRRHGFNGVTIHDWNAPELPATLDIAQSLGYRDVIVHATSPVKKTSTSRAFPIVNETVVEQFTSRGMEAMFYGYDEVGGNKRLPEQLDLNREIHRLGAKSVNAVFWKDLPQVNTSMKADRSECFDVIAHSLGSNGHLNMMRALPFQKNETVCPGSDTRHLVYWHPHVENPTANRLLMGFWLWASGFDGVIPHGHYFPSHIEKVLTKDDRQRGRSTAASPYDDWSFWLPRDTLRHHNAVYPSKTGPVGTLQWEGLLSGYTDLKYVVTLEERLALETTTAAMRSEIRSLLDEIRREVLQIRSPYMDDPTSLRYLRRLEGWRSEIRRLLLQNAAD